MANETEITSLRRERSNLSDQFQSVSRLLDEYEQPGQHNKATLITYQKQVDDIWKRFNIVNDKLLELDDIAPVDLFDAYLDLVVRLSNLIEINSSTTDASKTVANPKPPECSSNTPSSFQRRKNNFNNNNSNNDHTPPMENIVSNLAPIPSHGTRSSLHNTSSSSPTRDLTTITIASSQPEQSDTTPPNALNQKTPPIRNSSYYTRNVSPKRGLTTTTLASSVSEQSDSAPPNAVNQTTFHIRSSLPRRYLTTITIASLLSEQSGSKPPNAVNQTTFHIRSSSPRRDLTTITIASSLSEQSGSTPPNAVNQTTSHILSLSPTRNLRTTSHDLLDRKKLNPVQNSRVDFESKPTAEVSKSTMIGLSSSISTFNLSYTTPPVSPESRSIISESHFPGPSPLPKGATPASYPKRNNLHVITTVTNSSNEIDSCQNTSSALNTSPLNPQTVASDKSRTTNISLESPSAPTTTNFAPS